MSTVFASHRALASVAERRLAQQRLCHESCGHEPVGPTRIGEAALARAVAAAAFVAFNLGLCAAWTTGIFRGRWLLVLCHEIAPGRAAKRGRRRL